jgi:hypothetical protein
VDPTHPLHPRIRPLCQVCGGDDLIPILYGRAVRPDALAAAARGELELAPEGFAAEVPGQRCRGCGAGV